jgi:hypothetical protein
LSADLPPETDPHVKLECQATKPDDEVGLTGAIVGYASRYGRYGYRRILALLLGDGWVVNHEGAHLVQGFLL